MSYFIEYSMINYVWLELLFRFSEHINASAKLLKSHWNKTTNLQHLVIVSLWPATKTHKILKIVSIISFVSCILELWICIRGRVICVIWDLRPGVSGVSTLPGLYATYIGNLLPTFRDNLSTRSSGVKQYLDWSVIPRYRSLSFFAT
jgi:hypothetical protein